jgi:branched-chain amino acid aminotransferase
VDTRRLQRENPKAKLTGFIETAAAVRQQLPVGINEAIMVGADGRLLEGLSSNFFAMNSGVIWTAEQGVLSGITRSLVLEVIGETSLSLKLEGVRFSDLGKIEEAFITSASRAVQPVTEMDGKPVGTGRSGPVTRRIIQGYEERLERELDTI